MNTKEIQIKFSETRIQIKFKLNFLKHEYKKIQIILNVILKHKYKKKFKSNFLEHEYKKFFKSNFILMKAQARST